MFDGIGMDIVDVGRQIVHIGDDVLPKAALPHSAFAGAAARREVCRTRQAARESRLVFLHAIQARLLTLLLHRTKSA
jgi:hypothetical protein